MPPVRNPAGTKPAGQPGGFMPPVRNPAGTKPAGQPAFSSKSRQTGPVWRL
jgi:hypothetical protein